MDYLRRIGRKDILILFIIIIAAAAVLAWLYVDRERNRAVVLVGADADVAIAAYVEDDAPPAVMIVHVVGEVYYPGVFEFELGADVRVHHAIERAGGKTVYACDTLNMARAVRDGEQIRVFHIDDSDRLQAGEALAPGEPALININTATYQELQQLHNIGSARASAIIRHREARGGFNSIEELMNVAGIGQSIFDGIRDRITV